MLAIESTSSTAYARQAWARRGSDRERTRAESEKPKRPGFPDQRPQHPERPLEELARGPRRHRRQGQAPERPLHHASSDSMSNCLPETTPVGGTPRLSSISALRSIARKYPTMRSDASWRVGVVPRLPRRLSVPMLNRLLHAGEARLRLESCSRVPRPDAFAATTMPAKYNRPPKPLIKPERSWRTLVESEPH